MNRYRPRRSRRAALVDLQPSAELFFAGPVQAVARQVSCTGLELALTLRFRKVDEPSSDLILEQQQVFFTLYLSIGYSILNNTQMHSNKISEIDISVHLYF
jgi:hypothetical protein